MTALLTLLAMTAAWGRSVAVLPFDAGAKSEAYDGLGRALAGMVVSDLSRAPGVELVERARLDALLTEIELGEGGFVDPKTAQKLGKGVGAEWVVLGTFTVVGEQFLLDGRAVDVGTGKILAAVDAQGTVGDFVSVEKELVEELLAGLQVALSASERRQMLGDAPTEDFQAVASYGAGLQAEFEGQLEEARKRFQEAAERDPAFDLPLQRITALRAQLERLEAERQTRVVDERTAALERALARTPTEMDQTGPTRNDDERARYAIRFSLLERTDRRCQAAEEMAHYLQRHGGKLTAGAHPSAYNALHVQAFELGLYTVKPKPWDHGVVMPPNESVRYVMDKAPGVGWTGDFVIGTTDGPDKADQLGGSLLNEAIACAGPDLDARVRAVEGVLAQVRSLGIEQATTYSNSTMTVGIQLELMRAMALAQRDGMSAEVEAATQRLLNRKLSDDDAYQVRAKLARVTSFAAGAAYKVRMMDGATPEQVLALQRSWAAGAPGTFQPTPTCGYFLTPDAVESAKDNLERLEEHYTGGLPDEKGWDRVLQAAGDQSAPRLIGCVPGVPGLMPTLADALAWLEAAEKRLLPGRNEKDCADALAETRKTISTYSSIPENIPGLYPSLVARVPSIAWSRPAA